MYDLRPAPDGPGDVVFDGEYQLPAQCPRFRKNGGEGGVEQVNAPIAAAAGRIRDQAKIVHQDQVVALDGIFDHAEECLLDGRRPLRLAYVRSEEHTSELQAPCNLVCRLLLENKDEAYAASALHAWLSASAAVSFRTRRFARWSAIGSLLFFKGCEDPQHLPSFPTRGPSD